MSTADLAEDHLGQQRIFALPTAPVVCTSVAVVSCHGGAGTSTLVAQLGPHAHDAGPLTAATDTVELGGQAVIVVARGTACGARQAVDAAAALLRAGAVPVVAVVSDGPWPEPLAARARLRALSGHVPVIRVPYIARWRFEDTPSVTPARYERAVTKLRAAYCRCTDHPNDAQPTA